MREFTPGESKIINLIQRGIPLCHEPFKEIAASLGTTEKDVIETISSLCEEGVVRDISAIFSGEKLGYSASLVAFRLAEEDVERAASIVNSHPGVSHNYLRDHDFNMWFTLALPPGADFTSTVERMALASHAADHLVLRNERLFKIGMVLPVGNGEDKPFVAKDSILSEGNSFPADVNSREAVRLLQENLPLCERPFAEIVRRGRGCLDEEQLLEAARCFLEKGIIRRYAAVLRHGKAGYTANAMTAWRTSSGVDIEKLAGPFIESSAVTHLYTRTVYPGRWEHSLFAMVHAKSPDELDEIIETLSSKSGMRDYLVLRSLREFKKRRVRYFSPEFDTWETGA